MWSKIAGFFHSFSFRAGILIFITFCAVLLTMRILIYIQAIHTTSSDIKEIILAHSEAIQQSMEKHNMNYMRFYMQALLEDIHDKHIIIAIRDKNGDIIGNLKEWPDVSNKIGKYWVNFAIESPSSNAEDVEPPINITANVVNYNKGRSLLVGYNLKRLEIMEQALWMALVINAMLSFAAAFLLTFIMIFILNRHMRKLNITCNEVLEGNNTHRVKLSGADDEFERLAKNLNAMLDRNEALLEAVKDSTNALAHDMRTPLSRLRIRLQRIIEKPAVPLHVQEDLAESVGQIDKLAEMFQNILCIAQAETRAETNIFSSFDMVSLVRDIIDFYATFIEDKQQVLKTSLPENKLIFRGDRQLIAQAILNLLDNAVKYTPKKGAISISLMIQNDSELVCIIADSGPGIPEEFRDKVKERFFRMDASRSAEGSGLGMSLVEAVAKLHKGQLHLEDNNPGLKAMFVLPYNSQTINLIKSSIPVQTIINSFLAVILVSLK